MKRFLVIIALLTPTLLYAAEPSAAARARAALALASQPSPPPIDAVSAQTLHLEIFSQASCEPCQKLKAAMRADYCGVDAVVHEDTGPELLLFRHILNYPTIILYRDGQEVARREGCPDVPTLREWIAANKDKEPTITAPLTVPVTTSVVFEYDRSMAMPDCSPGST